MQLAANPQGEFEVPMPAERASAVREQVRATLCSTYHGSTHNGRCKPRWAGHGYTYPALLTLYLQWLYVPWLYVPWLYVPRQVQAKLGGLDDGFVGTIEAYMKKSDGDGQQEP
jgi:hypothetical protein